MTKKTTLNRLATTAGSVALAGAMFLGASANAGDKELDAKVEATVERCAALSEVCAATMQSADAVLVFPNVIEANLIIGGSGGIGALVENGQITGYYKIGGASAGLQAGIDGSSQVYVFGDATEVAELKTAGEWALGGNADVTVIDADASAQANTDGILAFVFDGEGLQGGIGIDVLRVWPVDQQNWKSSTEG